jgi:hypothetical protein
VALGASRSTFRRREPNGLRREHCSGSGRSFAGRRIHACHYRTRPPTLRFMTSSTGAEAGHGPCILDFWGFLGSQRCPAHSSIGRIVISLQRQPTPANLMVGVGFGPRRMLERSPGQGCARGFALSDDGGARLARAELFYEQSTRIIPRHCAFSFPPSAPAEFARPSAHLENRCSFVG